MTGFQLHFVTLLTLSWRNLWRNHRRTYIMLGAISVGVWAMIFMTALMRGMVDDMLNQGIRNLPGHIQIQHHEFLDDPSVVNSIFEPAGELLKALNQSGARRWATRIKVPAVIARAPMRITGRPPGTVFSAAFQNSVSSHSDERQTCLVS